MIYCCTLTIIMSGRCFALPQMLAVIWAGYVTKWGTALLRESGACVLIRRQNLDFFRKLQFSKKLLVAAIARYVLQFIRQTSSFCQNRQFWRCLRLRPQGVKWHGHILGLNELFGWGVVGCCGWERGGGGRGVVGIKRALIGPHADPRPPLITWLANGCSYKVSTHKIYNKTSEEKP